MAARYERWKPGTPVRITWQDATGGGDDWISEDEIDIELHEVETVGVLVKVTEQAVVIAQDYIAETKKWHSTGAVPRLNIMSIEKLRGPDER